MNADLEGKVVLVTGGAGGIGSVISKSFAEQNAKVIVHYHSSKDNAIKIANEINGRAIGADLTDSTETKKLFNEIIEKEGKVDVCVANAGKYPKEFAPLWELDDKRLNDTLSTNLSLTLNTSREFLKHTSQTKQGSLVFVGSTAGIYGEAGHADYAAAKGAITSGLLRTLKNEVAQIGDKVRINAVAPGWTVTQKKIDEGLNQDHVDKVVSTMALKKLASPEDVANSIVMLASNSLSGHITGQVIEIAGGMEGRLIAGTK
ncbi:MAG TPA: SDR family NAD(P)-dependent oxidoreductase [Candidatus Poseidoniia archaeon]|jgi:3-oxoacyl-[acyl-carrier protein] reductase|nr:SDR family NAD(P)-dependent oxidoreductase [Candidatus Poseidoniia archaeon]|tara:strand:- start:1681 stop:2460 length:780 start_codon:yes stop_codon:yes gene_type:complete